MKKYLLLLFTYAIFTNGNSQVGIGTNNPKSSSILDIESSNKGVLIPRVDLTSTTDVATIANPTHSLLVYNKNSVNDVCTGYYYYDTRYPKWVRFQAGNTQSVKYSNTDITTNLNPISGIDMPIFGNLEWNDEPGLFVQSGNQMQVTQTGRYQIVLHTYIYNVTNNDFAAPMHQIKVNGVRVGAIAICGIMRDGNDHRHDGAMLVETLQLSANDIITIESRIEDDGDDDDNCRFESIGTSNITITRILSNCN